MITTRHAPSTTGFSLIELLIVVAIMAALTGGAALNVEWVAGESRRQARVHNIRVIQKAIDDYREDRGVYPPDLDTLVATRYLRRVPVDPDSGRDDTWIGVPSAPGAGDLKDVRSSGPEGD